MRELDSSTFDYYIKQLRDDLKSMRRAVARPEPNYEKVCIRINLMIETLQIFYGLMNDLRNAYDYERARDQGPRVACPTSPAEDDPA